MTGRPLTRQVFLVTFSDWDIHWVASAWLNETDALAEAERLRGAHTGGSYDVEEFALDVGSIE